MGTGASVPTVGVATNPRVVYTDNLSKKENKNLLLDSPVLVDIQHGSIRYRRRDEDEESSDKSSGTERPHGGDIRAIKQGYFYHARMNDFTGSSVHKRNENHKFTYVVQGPASAKQKKLFYVYGFGMGKKDGQRILPTSIEARGDDYSWPERFKTTDVFYDLVFVKPGGEGSSGPDEGGEISKSGVFATRLRVVDSDKVGDVRRKLASLVQHAASDIYICYKKKKLNDNVLIVDLRGAGDGHGDKFHVDLVLL